MITKGLPQLFRAPRHPEGRRAERQEGEGASTSLCSHIDVKPITQQRQGGTPVPQQSGTPQHPPFSPAHTSHYPSTRLCSPQEQAAPPALSHGSGRGRAGVSPRLRPCSCSRPHAGARPAPHRSTAARTSRAHYVAGNTARLSPGLTIWQRPINPPQRLYLPPSNKRRAARHGKSPLAPLALTPRRGLSPSARSARYHQGGPARPSAIPQLPLPALPAPGSASSRPQDRRAIGQRAKDAATLLATLAVHQNRPTLLAYGTGAAEKPHPRRRRKESKQGGTYH